MAPQPRYIPLLCSCPCPAICHLPKPGDPSPDSLVPNQVCPLPGSVCPGQTTCPLPGFRDPREVWNLCLDFLTSMWMTSPGPRYLTSPVSLGAPLPGLSAPLVLGPCPVPFFSSSTILTLKLHSAHVRPFFSPVPQAWHCTQERRSSQRPRRTWRGRRRAPCWTGLWQAHSPNLTPLLCPYGPRLGPSCPPRPVPGVPVPTPQQSWPYR